MIKLPTTLNENTVLPFISLLYEANKDYVKTYNVLVKHIISLDKNAGSLLATFPTLMAYELINQKADLKEFNLLLEHFKNNLTFKRQIKNFFNQDSSIALKDYKVSKQNNINDIGYTIWDEVSFVFLDYSEDKKVHLKNENLPYFHSLINQVTIENCNEKEFFCLYYLPVILTNNISDIAEILKNHKEIGHKFIPSIKEMHSTAVEIDIQKSVINIFKENMDFDKHFYNIILPSDELNNSTFKIEILYVLLMDSIGQEEFIVKFNNHVETCLSKAEKYNVIKIYDRVLELCKEVTYLFKNISIDFNEQYIDTSKNLLDNCIYLSVLESQIIQSNPINLSNEKAKYLIKEINDIEENDNWNFANKLNFELFKEYALYSILDKNVLNKNIGYKKKKI